MAAVEWNKFIVIPIKYVNAMRGENRKRLRWVLQDVEKQRRKLGKDPDPRYWVVNQDEPYAEQIIKAILDGETAKEKAEPTST